jgi:DNA polymerase-3 subunit alpha
VYAGCFWENREEGDEAVLAAMREVTERMMDIFGDRWYGELQWNNIPEQHKLNKFIIQMHKEYGIHLISTADSHYPGREAWKDRELYKRLGWLGKKPEYLTDDLPSEEELKCELYPKNGQQMWESYRRYSQECDTEYDDDLVMESFAETHRIAFERIEDFMPDTTVRLPDFVVPEGATATQALARITIDALRSMGLHDNDEYVNRLKHELYVIDDRGFSKYFLTMKAIVDRANRLMLTGPGRGSAAGSLVAYILGITQIDPLKYDLQFARFLRSDATDYPDIDYDVAEPMSLKEALIEEWGDNTVVPISNWNTLQLRSLVKDISKFYNIPFTEVNKVTGAMIKEATGPAKKAKGMKAGMYTPNFEEVMKYSPSLQDFLEKYPHVKTHIEALHGQVRSCSRHAGGVVIAENLNEYMPLINSGGVRQTPWSEGQNVRHLEPMGFIKFDLLGLSTLRMIEGAIVHVLRRYHNIEEPSFEQVKKFYDEHLHPDKIDLQDKQVYENIFHKGDWAGVFQFTEEGAQNFCVQAKPTSIIDIAAVTSIFRPGPLSAKVDKDYIDAKESPQYIQYPND